MKTIIYIFLLFIIFILLLASNQVLASNPNDTYGTTPGAGQVTLDNPLGKDVSAQTLIGRIINAVLGIVGSLALVMFIYGGFIWMLAAGNNERVQRGKDIIIWAVIGLVIIFSAYALVKLVFTGLQG